MPIKISAKKRIRVSFRRKLENLTRKKAFKDAIKIATKALTSKDFKAAEKLSQAIAAIDKAAKTNTIHKNKAARLKSKLMKLAYSKKIQAKSAKTEVKAVKRTKKTEPKPAEKKPTEKKAKK